MFSKFIHLHVHSEYSVDTGYFNINDYIRYCYEHNVSSAVITEKFNLFSNIKFYKECKNFGIKPIIGCELFIEDENTFSKLILLAKNFSGYKNLIKIISQSYLNTKNNIPFVKKKWLPFLSKDLIAIGLSFESDIGQYLINNQINLAHDTLKFWNNAFKKSYYLSITNFGFPKESIYIEKLYNFIQKHTVQLVATNEVCFLKKIDFFAYKLKLATFDYKKKLLSESYDKYLENKYFKSSQEMLNTFNGNVNLLYNSFEIAKRCNLIFNFKKTYAPNYINNLKINTAKQLSKNTLELLFILLLTINKKYWFVYINRLKKELKIINSVGFADYFLITSDFIIKAKNNDIFVGPGRGSGSGSLVAHLLSISNINPINHNLLFERFLNKYRISSPDFDIDFCIEGRDIIIDYIFKKYRTKYVAQIITFGLMAVKAVIRDIGRALGYPYMFVDKIIKAISNNFGISIKSELIDNDVIKSAYNNSYDVQNIINLSLKLEGMVKNISKHAGGLVISNTKFSNLLPTLLEEDEYKLITHLDKNDSESIGFSKFDFLGLKTLSILSTTVETIIAYTNILKKIYLNYESDIILNDIKTLYLFQRADTLGIFQLDSIGIKSVLQKIKLDNFSEIVSLIALYRPGPLQSGMLTSFIKRKIGTEKIHYTNNALKTILSDTYGMLIYQEQVMLIAQAIGNYNIGFADFLRIAMSKKKKDDIKAHFKIFSTGAKKNNISIKDIKEIFNLIEKFAGYGFNKAHSVGYGILTYNSAWLKSHYNIFFITALISSDMDNYENTRTFIDDAKYFSIGILKPDINRSFYSFTLINKNKIRYGLGTIKGLGKSIITEILNNRSIFGYFKSFFDFLYRLEIELLGKRTLEALVYSGCFNKLNIANFKLVLISAKVFDLYKKIISTFKSDDDFLNNYFNYSLKTFSYLINYKTIQLREIQLLLNSNVTQHILYFYKYEFQLIEKLSFKSGKYITKINAGLINKLFIKNLNVNIEIKNINIKEDINFNYFRYKSLEKLIKKYNLIVLGYYKNNNKNYELFVENFYLFRYKFLKYIDIIFIETYISYALIKKIHNKLLSFIKGCTIINFKIPFKGKYKKIKIKNKLTITLHDENINELLQLKEIKGLKFKYIF